MVCPLTEVVQGVKELKTVKPGKARAQRNVVAVWWRLPDHHRKAPKHPSNLRKTALKKLPWEQPIKRFNIKGQLSTPQPKTQTNNKNRTINQLNSKINWEMGGKKPKTNSLLSTQNPPNLNKPLFSKNFTEGKWKHKMKIFMNIMNSIQQIKYSLERVPCKMIAFKSASRLSCYGI